MSRSIVGRFVVSPACDFEFIPVSTSVKYKCELTGIFHDLYVATAASRSDIVIISQWHWLTFESAQILVADASSITLASALPDRSVERPGRRLSGIITGISAFLRIKDSKDPFNNSFCVHLAEGHTVILRSARFYFLRFLLENDSYIVFRDLKKLKLKSFNDLIVHISGDDSDVLEYQARDRGVSLAAGTPVSNIILGRVTSLNPGGSISLERRPGDTVEICLNSWAKCERRKLSIGTVLKISNFHQLSDTQVLLCPASTCIVVPELPPMSPAIVWHGMDAGNSKKFGINFLCACHCDLENIETNQLEIDRAIPSTLPDEFQHALRESETCLLLSSLESLFHLRAPPFLNISLESSVQVEIVGPPSAEMNKQLESLPASLKAAIFPPSRPLNAYVAVRLTETQSRLSILTLISRTYYFIKDTTYDAKQLLIIGTACEGHVHGVFTKDDWLVPREVGGHRSTNGQSSPRNHKLNDSGYRRRLLRSKIASIV